MPTLSRLGTFMEQTRIKPTALARESGYSRQHLLRLRYGTMEPSRQVMVNLAEACSRLVERRVRVQELFDLGDEQEPTPTPAFAPPLSTGTRWHARLRKAVRASGQSQAEISRRSGVPEETISRVMTGQSANPQIETVVCIAHAIGVTVGWLLEERGYSMSVEQVQRLRDASAVIAEVAGPV
jgi:transcriptional regulator with XRE-family HTH domain